MSSNNINDSSAIQALLDQLKASDAWQQVANTEGTNPPFPPGETSGTDPTQGLGEADALLGNAAVSLHPLRPHDTSASGSREPLGAPPQGTSNAPSVASLLSQLQASNAFSTAASPARHTPAPPLGPSSSGGPRLPEAGGGPSPSKSTPPAAPPTPRRELDLRACTFQQALPHLARLSEDAGFVQALRAMSAEQAELERRLWGERQDIQRKHEEKVKAARTSASIIGAAGLTQYEADMLTDSFRAELARFDRERVLPAWDGLVTKQQAALEALGVPAMFPSTQSPDRERQQNIMQVLGGIVGNPA